MSEPFIQLRRSAATPQSRRQSTPGVPPPPPPAPDQQGGAIPQVVPAPQHQNMAPQLPPPPFHVNPTELRGRPPVQVSDIRPDRMTEGDAREQLTQFKIIRLEKCSTTNEVDAEGKAIKPTWAKCFTIDENDVEQVEARRRVKALDKEVNKYGKIIPVTEKKASLPAALKSQLEKLQFQLQHGDDPRFIYALVQLEDLCKPLDNAKADNKGTAQGEAKDKDRRKEKKYVRDKFETKRIASEKKSKTKLKERIAVRAYYKRSPAPDQDCLQLLQQQNTQLRQQQNHQRDQLLVAMMHQQQQHQAQMQPPQPPQPSQMPPSTVKPPDVQIVHLDGKKGKHSPRLSHSSEDSCSSDAWSESDGTEFQTPQSSVGSHACRRKRYRRHERKHRKDNAKYYNTDRVPRVLPMAESLHIVTTVPRGHTPVAPISPQPRLPPAEVDRLRSIRYWDCDEQFHRNRRDEEPRRRTIEPAYTHRPLRWQRSYPRMSPVETRRERFDNFEFDREHRENLARLDQIKLEEEREQDRRAEDAAHERYMRAREHGHRVGVRAHGIYHQEPEYHAPYIRTVEPTYVDQEVRAEGYMESRSAGYESHPFRPRPRRMMYEDRF
ncbi:hypothetical protein NLU13_6149 [Sarocladium strictum]|uniref:Uncharacterized protein n=1 Tax=Sarocladium strictum TaxID=5046 RepID=A0AA39L6V3_SARSR|nr:hypothetical protein NLU13_6149 [Sarocladium strictum]